MAPFALQSWGLVQPPESKANDCLHQVHPPDLLSPETYHLSRTD